VKVTGNIHAVDSDEKVFGIFEVSGIIKTGIFLTKDLISAPLPPIEQIYEDCTSVYTNGSNQKPIFW
jgi:hypothetical protein